MAWTRQRNKQLPMFICGLSFRAHQLSADILCRPLLCWPLGLMLQITVTCPPLKILLGSKYIRHYFMSKPGNYTSSRYSPRLTNHSSRTEIRHWFSLIVSLHQFSQRQQLSFHRLIPITASNVNNHFYSKPSGYGKHFLPNLVVCKITSLFSSPPPIFGLRTSNTWLWWLTQSYPFLYSIATFSPLDKR